MPKTYNIKNGQNLKYDTNLDQKQEFHNATIENTPQVKKEKQETRKQNYSYDMSSLENVVELKFLLRLPPFCLEDFVTVTSPNNPNS